MKIVKIFISLIILFFSIQIQAQKTISYMTYKEALNFINPGNVGVSNNVEALAVIRSQWVGAVEKAPQTQFLSFAMPFKNNLSGGFTVVNFSNHITKETDIFVDVAYRINVDENKTISFGLKGGGSIVSVDFPALGVNDPKFSQAINGDFNPDIGAGIFINSDTYFVGVAVPRFIGNKRHVKDIDTNKINDKPQIYFNGGYVFDLSSKNMEISLTPSVLTVHNFEQNSSLEFSLNLKMIEKIEVGLAARLKQSFSVVSMFNFSDNYKVGYAFEYATSGLKTSTHEIALKASF